MPEITGHPTKAASPCREQPLVTIPTDKGNNGKPRGKLVRIDWARHEAHRWGPNRYDVLRSPLGTASRNATPASTLRHVPKSCDILQWEAADVQVLSLRKWNNPVESSRTCGRVTCGAGGDRYRTLMVPCCARMRVWQRLLVSSRCGRERAIIGAYKAPSSEKGWRRSADCGIRFRLGCTRRHMRTFRSNKE